MPLDVTIDRERRRVLARAHGVLSIEDLFDYHRSVVARPDVAGYDELVDLGEVSAFASASSEHARQLATLAARDDLPDRPTRFAIVAAGDLEFGLARMYATYRGLQERGTKEVRVFRSRGEALAWLDPVPVGAP